MGQCGQVTDAIIQELMDTMTFCENVVTKTNSSAYVAERVRFYGTERD